MKILKNHNYKSLLQSDEQANMDESEDYEKMESKESFDQMRRPSFHSDIQEDYTTNINQLISEPNTPTKTQYFLATLYELSLYLFKKNTKQDTSQQINASFHDYLNSVSKEINIYETSHKKARLALKKIQQQTSQNSQQLLQCYQRVPYAYFSQNFVLDFGQLAKNIEQIKKKQEQLNEDLDSVEINLFNQIHNKFHQYFKVVSNFQYLSQSLEVNIMKNNEARMRLNKVRVDFVEKSYNLKSKIAHRQSIEKTLKMLKIIKSLQKLPFVLKQILESSLPYQCLSLLKSTKDSLQQVGSLKCLDKVSQTIKQSQSLVQMGLNKRYADELYLYLEQCQYVNLQEGWDRINSNNCMDMSGFNNSFLGVSQILQESVLEMQPSTSKNKRNQGKEFQIAMILLESYKYMAFPVDLIRIKVSNSLRIFCKRFDTDLTQCLTKILDQKNQKLLESQTPPVQPPKSQTEQSQLATAVQKITVIFYVKHLLSFNQIMKDTIDRFLGYLHTLLIEYNQSKEKDKDEEKFYGLFREELSILPAICKIVIQKLKVLMTLKNINGIGFQEFKQWISVLEYWKKYTDNLIEQNPLISMQRENDPIEQAINDTLKKMINIFAINSTLSQLVLNYITIYHSNTISQLQSSFIDESWQAIQIPSEFVQVLNDITQWHDPPTNPNTSVTILNDSKQLKPLSMNKSLTQDYSAAVRKSTKFRVLKSNVMVDGVRFKISVSFLLVCQFIGEYVKMARGLDLCRRLIYQRMLNLVEYYNNRARELILQAKARQYEKMKAKNISAKHICLVHNCLSVLQKLIKQLSYPQVSQLKSITLDSIQTHKTLLINKLSYLIKSKVQSTITAFLLSPTTSTTTTTSSSNIPKDQKVAQVNLSLLNVFVQMMGIIDQFLEFQDKKAVFKEAIEIFMGRYFKELLLKGDEYSMENKILVEKMRFLRQYFPEELEVMEKEAKAHSSHDN